MSLHCIVWCCMVLYCWLWRAGCISQDTYLLYKIRCTLIILGHEKGQPGSCCQIKIVPLWFYISWLWRLNDDYQCWEMVSCNWAIGHWLQLGHTIVSPIGPGLPRIVCIFNLSDDFDDRVIKYYWLRNQTFLAKQSEKEAIRISKYQ